jgi:hypothetical protein
MSSRTMLSGLTFLAAVMASLLSTPEDSAAQSWRTVNTSRQLAGEREVDVLVRYGAGTFQVHPAEEGNALYRMRLRYDEDALQPLSEYRDGRLQLGVQNGTRILPGGRSGSGEMDLALTRSVPMDLKLEFGAVRAELDLGGLSLRTLELSTGASEAVLDIAEPNRVRMTRARMEVGAASFTASNLGNLNADLIDISAGVGEVKLNFDGAWQGDMDVKVGMGLGSLELGFPRGLGVRINRSTFLTSFDSQELVRRGEAYYSENWDQAEHRVTLSVEAAFGSIKVHWFDGESFRP